jgi:hypothetical protein
MLRRGSIAHWGVGMLEGKRRALMRPNSGWKAHCDGRSRRRELKVEALWTLGLPSLRVVVSVYAKLIQCVAMRRRRRNDGFAPASPQAETATATANAKGRSKCQ